MPITKYSGTDLNRVPSKAGLVECVATAANQILSASTGSSIPCKEVWIYSVASNLAISYVSFASANVSRGVAVPIVSSTAIHSTLGIPRPLRFPIDDVAKIWVYIITSGDTVGVLYRN